MSAPVIITSAATFHDNAQKVALTALYKALYDRFSSQSLTDAGIAIKGGSASPTAATVNEWIGVAGGKLVAVAAAADLPALVGTVAHAAFNVFAFFVDNAGTVTSAMGTAGASLDLVIFPATPVGSALLGFVVINPTGTGDFVGGTTNLDDVTKAPNAVFVNTVGAFDLTMKL